MVFALYDPRASHGILHLMPVAVSKGAVVCSCHMEDSESRASCVRVTHRSAEASLATGPTPRAHICRDCSSKAEATRMIFTKQRQLGSSLLSRG
jgi:hypothetical protein